MRRLKSIVPVLAAVALLATGLAASISLPAVAADAAVTLPTTPAEHGAEAARYEKESLELEAKATEHTERAARYKARMIGMSRKQSSAYHGIYKHCERLAKAYRNAAAEAREMAAMHRTMATE
jgi:hypothetical protein